MSKRKIDGNAGAPAAKKTGGSASGNTASVDLAAAGSAVALQRGQLSSQRAAVTLKLSNLLRSHKTFGPKLVAVTAMLLDDAQRDQPN